MTAGSRIGPHDLPACAVQHPSPSRADVSRGAVSPDVGQGAQGPAAGDEGGDRTGASRRSGAAVPAERHRFVARYEALLATGLAANPPPPRPAHHTGRQKQSPARNLLERLWLGQDAVLAFLDDLGVPFDNNQAERDLRMLKVQQKVSGCFRSTRGGTAFGRIRSYLSTLSKQGMRQLEALESLFTGQLLSPSSGSTVTKKLAWSVEQKRQAIEVDEPCLSIRRQCDLLGLSRGSWQYQSVGESEENLQLMRLLDEQYTSTP